MVLLTTEAFNLCCEPSSAVSLVGSGHPLPCFPLQKPVVDEQEVQIMTYGTKNFWNIIIKPK